MGRRGKKLIEDFDFLNNLNISSNSIQGMSSSKQKKTLMSM